MKKNYLLVVAIMLLLTSVAFGQQNQNVLRPFVELIDTAPQYAIPTRLMYMDKVNFGIYGSFKQLMVYDPTEAFALKFIQTVNGLNNTAKLVGTQWASAGDVFIPPDYNVIHHYGLNSGEYITTKSPPYLRILNTQSHTYEGVSGLIFNDAPEVVVDWGNQQLLFVGGFGILNGGIFSGPAIWNIQTNVVKKSTGPWGTDDQNPLANFYWLEDDDMLIADDYFTGEMYGLKKGEFVWKKLNLASIPFYHRFFSYVGSSISDLYCAIGTYDVFQYEIYKCNNTWEKVMTLEPQNYELNNPLCMTTNQGLLYIGGAFTKSNGGNTSGLLSYNPATGVTSDVVSVFPGTITPDLIRGLYFIGDNLYVSTYGSIRDIFTGQTIFIVDGVALPVKILNFVASIQGKNTLLSWQTAEELNTKEFEVERSNDGRVFTNIGTVTAKGGSTGSLYRFTDATTLAGKNFYRLKIIDNDGSVEYSQVRSIDMMRTTMLYPNPTKDFVNVATGISGKGQIQIIDSKGVVVKRIEENFNPQTTRTVSLVGLSTGMYFLQIVSSANIERYKIIKQ